jgi:hypothetical protein
MFSQLSGTEAVVKWYICSKEARLSPSPV